MTEYKLVNSARLDKKASAGKPVVLMVEDHPDEIYVFRAVLERAKLDIDLRVLHTAAEGIDWLAGHAPYNDREQYPVPDFLITDFNTPRMTGGELLRWARATEVYGNMPIIIHSGTLGPGEGSECMKQGATAVIQKEPLCPKLVEAVKQLVAPE